MAMEARTKPRAGSEEDLCDTCSGDTDEVCSLCSWTTDQEGEFTNLDTVDVRDSTSESSSCQNGYGPAWSTAQGSVMNDASTPANPMSMCVVMMPVCYVGMPAMENGLPWQDANAFCGDQWQQLAHQKDSALRWNQGRTAPGTWTSPYLPTDARCRARDSTGFSSSQRSKGKKTPARSSHHAAQSSTSSEATTVILRNLPMETTRDMLLEMLDVEGFWGAYDFLHLPIDFQTKTGLGYALLNLVSHEAALRVQRHFEGFKNWPCPSDNVCEVAWNSPHQGLATHIERYRNSPLFHASVPETYRPVIFVNGTRAQFPSPTSRVRAPRIRHQKPGAALTA